MPDTRDTTVLIFGAGASKASGTPLTNEILWRAFCDEDVIRELGRHTDRAIDLEKVHDCLTEHFHIPELDPSKDDFPSLTLLLSILDLSINRNRPFPASEKYPSGLSREELAHARASIEYIIFAVLDYYIQRPTGHAQRDLISHPAVAGGAQGPQIISLNYDIIADTTVCQLAQDACGDVGRVDYSCDVCTEAYTDRRPYGKLLKLHGSLNWLFCPGCQALQVGMSANGKNIADSSMLKALYDYRPLDEHYLCSKASCSACQCEYCDTPLRPVMITPSFVKDYHNPHIQRIWYEAERLLRRCGRAYLVGYSLPDDDLEVIHLLRRGLEGCESHNITVVTQGNDEAMYRRYVSLFGRDIDWHPEGLDEWMTKVGPGPTAAPVRTVAPRSVRPLPCDVRFVAK
jgi:hypothetical protein